MNKYSNCKLIDMHIIVDGEQCILPVFDLFINKIIKVPDSGIEWEHVYDLSTKYHKCEDIDLLSNMIGDFFNGVPFVNSTDNVYRNCQMYFIKFINMYVIPFINDEQYVKNYLKNISMTSLFYTTNKTTVASKFDRYETGIHKPYGIEQGKTTVTVDIPLFGDIRDMEVFYQLIINSAYSEIIKIKWFHSIACIIAYLDLNNIVNLTVNNHKVSLTDVGITSADIDVISGTNPMKGNMINYVFSDTCLASTVTAIKIIRYAIEYRKDIVFSEMTNVVANVKKFIDYVN